MVETNNDYEITMNDPEAEFLSFGRPKGDEPLAIIKLIKELKEGENFSLKFKEKKGMKTFRNWLYNYRVKFHYPLRVRTRGDKVFVIKMPSEKR